MKHMHKLLSVIIVLALAMSLAVPAFAADDVPVRIQVNLAEDANYNVYKVLTKEGFGYVPTFASNVASGESGGDTFSTFECADFTEEIEQAIESGDISPVGGVEKSYENGVASLAWEGTEQDFPAGYYVDTNPGTLILLEQYAWDEGGFSVAQVYDEPGTITIDNASSGQMYKVYQILTLESYNNNARAFAYKAANDDWSEFLNSDGIKDAYVQIDDQGYVTWIGNEDDELEFVKVIKNFVEDNQIAPTAYGPATGETVVFDNLPLGYYMMDSSLGTLCSLDTTTPTVTIHEKNDEPTLKKYVQEDSSNAWGETNDAEIGQVVNFKIEVDVKPGAENYLIHDRLSSGLTMNLNSIEINGLTKDVDYTVVTEGICDDKLDTDDVDESCDFHIVFKPGYMNSIYESATLTITYNATLNENALVFNGDNTNEAWLVYGEENQATEIAKTKTHTFSFDLVKTDSQDNVISGAEFKLYDAATGGNEIPVVKVSDGVYRKAVDGETGVVIEAGHVTIQGLDGQTEYYLEETKAPEGYNKANGRTKVSILRYANETATVTNGKYVEGGVKVINKTGSLFPETGGIGTTIFYIVGGLMAVGAAVLLVTKRRMTVGE